MLLFSKANAAAVDDPEYGHFEAGPETGAFDFPDDLAERLHRVYIRGKKAWETETEREERLHSAESARRRDPETLYAAVADIANVTKQLAGLQLAASTPQADADPDAAKATAGRRGTKPPA